MAHELDQQVGRGAAEEQTVTVDPIAQAGQEILAEAQAAATLAEQQRKTIEDGRQGWANLGRRRKLGYTQEGLDRATAAAEAAEAHAALVAEVVNGDYRYTSWPMSNYDGGAEYFDIQGTRPDGQKELLRGWADRQHEPGPGYGPGAHFTDVQRYSRTVGERGRAETGRDVSQRVKAVRGVVQSINRRAAAKR